MLKLKLQYFGHLMQRTDSVEKTLKKFKIYTKVDKTVYYNEFIDSIKVS